MFVGKKTCFLKISVVNLLDVEMFTSLKFYVNSWCFWSFSDTLHACFVFCFFPRLFYTCFGFNFLHYIILLVLKDLLTWVLGRCFDIKDVNWVNFLIYIYTMLMVS